MDRKELEEGLFSVSRALATLIVDLCFSGTWETVHLVSDRMARKFPLVLLTQVLNENSNSYHATIVHERVYVYVCEGGLSIVVAGCTLV